MLRYKNFNLSYILVVEVQFLVAYKRVRHMVLVMLFVLLDEVDVSMHTKLTDEDIRIYDSVWYQENLDQTL